MKRLCLLLLASILWSASAQAAISYINAWNTTTTGQIASSNIDTSTNGQAGAGHPIAANDVLIAPITWFNATTAVCSTAMSGGSGTWSTAITEVDNSAEHMVVCYKVAVLGDVNAVFTFTPSGNSYISGGIIDLRGANTSSPIDKTSSNTGTSGAITAPTVTPTVANEYLVWAAGDGTVATIAFPSSPAMSAGFQITGSASAVAATVGYNAYTSGATGSVASSTTSTNWIAALIAVALPGVSGNNSGAVMIISQ